MGTLKRITYSPEFVDFKALNDKTGEFSAAVSVIGNVDLQGDVVESGAFDESLAGWRDKGDPVPIIWSHEWGDPFAHVGWADPNQIEEMTLKGVKNLGANAASGILLIKEGHFDVDKPFAKQVYDLVKGRRVKEWSFAYDIMKEHPRKDGSNGLQIVDLIEAGPTLKGANPDTFTVTVKHMLEKAARRQESGLPEKLSDAINIDPELARALMKSVPTVTEREHITLVSRKELEQSSSKYLGIGGDAPTGSQEETRAALQVAVNEWADQHYTIDAEGDRAYPWVIGTYSDHIVVCVEQYDAPSEYYTFPYTMDNGSATLGDPSKVDVETVVTPAKSQGEVEVKTDEEKAWDGSAAMATCHSAADYRKIAFERDNTSDPATAAHWALPHHDNPGAGANPDGVSAAIGALNGARGGAPKLKDEAAARSHLEAHQAAEGKDGEDEHDLPPQIMDSKSIEERLAAVEAGLKAGRVIGAKAASNLKTALTSAVDEFVAEVNGSGQAAEDGKDDEPSGAKSATAINSEIMAQLDALDK